MSTPAQRRQRIRELLARNDVLTQEQLLALLEVEGMQTTQATISRDLKELGVRKAPRGYAMPAVSMESPAGRKHMAAPLRGLIERVERGGTVVVLHTRAGQADTAALAMNRCGLREVLGAIAGNDVVFIATQTAAQARSLQRLISEAVG
jgi:transcriptional regulator of arginine metabolism